MLENSRLIGYYKTIVDTWNSMCSSHNPPLVPLMEALKHKRILIVSHRGKTDSTVENTLVGFQKALHQGAQILECDVQLSKEGIPVIFHDKDSSRMVEDSVSKVITNTSLEEMRSWKISVDATIGKICTFTELLNECKGKCYFYVELKTFADQTYQQKRSLVEAVWFLVNSKHEVSDQCMLVSFDEEIIDLIHLMELNVLTGLNFEGTLRLFKEKSWHKSPLNVVCPDSKLLNKENCLYWRRNGFFIIPYTVNSEEGTTMCKNLEVDAVITDDVIFVRNNLNSLLKANTPQQKKLL